MKKAATLVVAVLSCATAAWAQQAQQSSVTSKINLTMEQRHVIKEAIKELKIQNASGTGKIEIGDEVPKSVHLQAMPPAIGNRVSPVKSHTFFVRDGQIVLVDPSDNKVVEIIE